MLLNTVLNSATVQFMQQLSEHFVLQQLASGQDFQNTTRPALPYFLYFKSTCAQYPIHRVLLPCPRSPRSC